MKLIVNTYLQQVLLILSWKQIKENQHFNFDSRLFTSLIFLSLIGRNLARTRINWQKLTPSSFLNTIYKQIQYAINKY